MHQVNLASARVVAFLGIGCAILAGTLSAYAQNNYPDRSIRFIVPFPPGGQNDNVSRALGNVITPIIGTAALGTATAVAYSAALALAAGAIYIVLGVLRMGWVSTFLSKAVMAWRTSSPRPPR